MYQLETVYHIHVPTRDYIIYMYQLETVYHIHVPTRDYIIYMYQLETVYHIHVPTLAVITFIVGGHWEEGFSVGDVLLNVLSSLLN